MTARAVLLAAAFCIGVCGSKPVQAASGVSDLCRMQGLIRMNEQARAGATQKQLDEDAARFLQQCDPRGFAAEQSRDAAAKAANNAQQARCAQPRKTLAALDKQTRDASRRVPYQDRAGQRDAEGRRLQAEYEAAHREELDYLKSMPEACRPDFGP